jgi:septum formation protein
MLGKPADPRDAARMLAQLSGRTHRVVSGVCLKSLRGRDSGVETTEVRFAPLSRPEIDWYVASGEPMGKAGAYAVQGLGARFIVSLAGSYSNVVGLPARLVYEMLLRAGFERLARP